MKNFINAIVKLDNIKQWEERDSVVKESVSQHSFKSAAIAVYLSRLLCQNASIEAHMFFNECISYALLHDFDEAILGRDLSHVLKYNAYNGEQIRAVMNDFVDKEIKEKYVPIDDLVHPDNDVKLFCKFIDWYCLQIFIERNEAMGCKTFSYERNYCGKKVCEFINKVRSMLERKFGEDMVKKYNEIIDLWLIDF